MTYQSKLPAETPEDRPEEDVLKFISAKRNQSMNTSIDITDDAAAAQESSNVPEIDISQHFNPSVPVGRLAAEHMNDSAHTMGSNVINLAERRDERRAAEQKQHPAEHPLWTAEPQSPAQEASGQSTVANDNDPGSIARSLARPSEELNNDLKKAA